METENHTAPGAPGIEARWTSSAKSGVGTALTASPRLWFTLSHGILNEVYHPRLDRACTRDFGLIVTGDDGYFSEEKRHASHEVNWGTLGVPAFHLTNTTLDGRFRIEKDIITDPLRPTLLQKIRFTRLGSESSPLRVYALLAPHLVNAGMNNSAWVGEYKGVRMLFASGRGQYLALASSLGWGETSVGYAGISDGWQQLSQSGRLEQQYASAPDGNVALTGQIGFTDAADVATLALSFGPTPEEAAYNALASLNDGYDSAAGAYISQWQACQKTLLPLDDAEYEGAHLYRQSTAVLTTHRSPAFPGPAVASLSIPWGASKGDDDLGGYHLVWPRDLVETAGGFIAAGAPDAALEILNYLRTIQEEDGHWPQNAWMDGRPYWDGIQMDECGFPLLLLDRLYRLDHIPKNLLDAYLPMVERATSYLVRNGPVTGEDRWEEDSGYSPFTLAVEIAALIAAADILETCGRLGAARLARETADCWNEQIEKWTYVQGNDTCAAIHADGYYVRIAPASFADAASPKDGFVPIKNRPPDDTDHLPAMIVSPDALALVRFGLRAPDDPRIINTIKVIDAYLKAELPQGPVWYRYTDDGYGEHPDGAPFDGVGQGRPWPLLTGERAHYELAAGDRQTALELLKTFAACAGPGGLLPEQVWDGVDLPEEELFRGKPTGSAMPLVWAHAEYIKLLRSLRDGEVFDVPQQVVERYVRDRTQSSIRVWRFNNRIRTIPKGKSLRIDLLAKAVVHWSCDGWATVNDTETTESELGIHCCRIDLAENTGTSGVEFTFFWVGADRWEGENFHIGIDEDET